MDTFAFLWQKETAAPLYVKMTHPPLLPGDRKAPPFYTEHKPQAQRPRGAARSV